MMIGTSAMQSTESLLQMHQLKNSPSSSSRILDIPCKVCGDFSSGKHYNIFACDGCAGFFKRSIRRNRQYICKAKPEGSCVVDKTHRNQCRSCRLTKCQDAGMNKDAVQHERGPRNSTLRRQHMTHYYDPRDLPRPLYPPTPTSGHVLDLAMPKPGTTPPHHLNATIPMLPTNAFMCNPVAVALFAAQQQQQQTSPVPTSIAALTPPTPQTTAATICESAAQLLFMNVKWAKNVPSFTGLPAADQLLLLEESWRELFILGASQFRVPLELGALVQASGIIVREPERLMSFVQEVKEFQALLARTEQFNLDPHEYACLRAIVLFKTGFERQCASPSVSSTTSNAGDSSSGPASGRVLSDLAAVNAIQDNTQLVLNKYITTAQPCQPLRFGKLLMLLPHLRAISSETIEELFFRSTIGTIPIVRIICDMYKSTTTESGF